MLKSVTLIFASWVTSQVAAAEPEVITLEGLTDRVSQQNFTVRDQMQKLYQAREAIQVARMNLYPSLNLSRVGVALVDWTQASGEGEFILPFLVPQNCKKHYYTRKFIYIKKNIQKIQQNI